MTKKSSIHDYFDKVYVINLDRRPDRKVAMLQKLIRVGIEAEFVVANDGKTPQNQAEYAAYLEKLSKSGEYPRTATSNPKWVDSAGAWAYLKTYYGLLTDAQKRGFKRILVFDDDALFHKDFEHQFQQATKQLPCDWKLLYLGAAQYVWSIPDGLTYPNKKKLNIDLNEPFYHPNRTDASFAVGIDSSVFDILMEGILKMDCAFDSGIMRTVNGVFPDKCFVLLPNLVIQDVSESDIRTGQNQIEIAKRLKWDLNLYGFDWNPDLVSVLMPAYNAEKTIEKSIQSILQQSYPHLELIVADDASTDATARVVKALMEKDTRIKLVSLDQNKGVGAARNAALKLAKGNLIAIQDADDISLRHRLAYQLIPIYEKKVLFTISRNFRSPYLVEEIDINNEEFLENLIKQQEDKNDTAAYSYYDRMHIGMVTTVFQRAVFERYGIFEEHRFGEDVEYVERLLFFAVGIQFEGKNNAHRLLNFETPIFKVFHRVEQVLLLSLQLNSQNLTMQHEGNLAKKLQRRKESRLKFKERGLDAFEKFKVLPTIKKYSTDLNYNTSRIKYYPNNAEENFSANNNRNLSNMTIPEHIEEKKLLKDELEKMHQSVSWRVTKPLRWIGSYLLCLLKS